MKILYAIQGTGNGHITRANEIIPHLKQYGELDLFVSGFQSDLLLPYEIKYKSRGISFVFGKSGGIDFVSTLKNNNLQKISREIQEFPAHNYDVIINDFEPVSAWAAQKKRVLCISLSHQAALLSPGSPQPKSTEFIGRWILENFAPSGMTYGFHFQSYDKNIFTPVIRKRIRENEGTHGDHYTVYLPAYSDEKLVKKLASIQQKGLKWHIFSKHTRRNYKVNNINVYSLDADLFMDSMISSRGVICGAGFETPAEALSLHKKLLVVPMKNQYEQACNAEALMLLGVPVIKKIGDSTLDTIKAWIEDPSYIPVHFPDITAEVVELVMNRAEQMLKGEQEFLAQV